MAAYTAVQTGPAQCSVTGLSTSYPYDTTCTNIKLTDLIAFDAFFSYMRRRGRLLALLPIRFLVEEGVGVGGAFGGSI